jgi:hypothetical protein
MKQPEALRLAKELVSVHKGHADEGPSTFSEAAAELRRLHEANQAMLEALGLILASDDWLEIERIARAAIAKEDQL